MAWVIQQLREALPFGLQPTYLFRDNDGIYEEEVSRFLEGTGIEEAKTAYRRSWENPFMERYIATLWRELLDHVIVLSEGQLTSCYAFCSETSVPRAFGTCGNP